jgi:hypothetical protein
MTEAVRPTGITLNKNEGYLEIVWNDGQVCQYPLSHLREACPCVECRGGHQFMGSEYDPSNLLELKPKRSYAFNPPGTMGIPPAFMPGNICGVYARQRSKLWMTME